MRAGRFGLWLPLLVAMLTIAGLEQAWAASQVRYEFDFTPAERIIVEKSARQLTLVRADGRVRKFDIALGKAPWGHKTRQGDSRTPEGTYRIEYKNLNSKFFLSLKISYPNAADRARASAMGVSPGGDIMIHGMPNDAKRPYKKYQGRDWTDGCIAVSNDAMMEIWMATREDTLVEIRP